jgi:hypothetical protein
LVCMMLVGRDHTRERRYRSESVVMRCQCLKACWEARWEALYNMNVPTTAANILASGPPEMRCKGNGIAGSSSPRGHTSAWRHHRPVGTEWGCPPRRHASSSGLRSHGMFEAGQRWGDLPMAGPPLPGPGVGSRAGAPLAAPRPGFARRRSVTVQIRKSWSRQSLTNPERGAPRPLCAHSSEPLNAGLTGGVVGSLHVTFSLNMAGYHPAVLLASEMVDRRRRQKQPRNQR